MTTLTTPSKPSISPCLALSLRKANRVMTQIYDHSMARHGIKITQFAILRAMFYLREATNRKLQDVLILDQTTLSRNLKPLLRDGFLLSKEGTDRREKLLTLSEEGRTLFKTAEEDWEVVQEQLQEQLGDALTAQLLTVNEAVVALKDKFD